MDWYKFNIGDYQRATEGLSPLEHWAYRSLIDEYYLRSGPLPADDQTLCRMIGALTKNERAAVKNIRIRFLTENGDGKLHIPRCDQEIQEYQRLCDAARSGGRSRQASVAIASGLGRTKELTKEVQKPVDNSTCQHVKIDGSKCGAPGIHKLHPQSPKWYCREHENG